MFRKPQTRAALPVQEPPGCGASESPTGLVRRPLYEGLPQPAARIRYCQRATMQPAKITDPRNRIKITEMIVNILIQIDLIVGLLKRKIYFHTAAKAAIDLNAQ